MPTYQYVCTVCGHDFEAVQSFSDDALTECPNCGGPLRKKFGAVGVVFKGSGFYITDYRSEGYKSAAKKDSGSSESKPAKESTVKEGGSLAEKKPAAPEKKSKTTASE